VTAFTLLSVLLACGLEDVKYGDSGAAETVDPDTLDEGGDSDGDEDADDGGGPSDEGGGSDDGGDTAGSTTAGTTDGGETDDGETDDGETDDGGTGGSTTAGTTDGGGTGAGGTTTGGDTLDGLGGCILDGVCSDGFAYGECIAFGGTWVSEGCPATSECHDVVFYPDYSPYYIDPADPAFEDDFDLSCNLSDSRDVAYLWTPPSTREYCITASVAAVSEGTLIAPVLSIWSVDCATELECEHGDWDAPDSSVSLRGEYSPDESYLVVLEHDLSTEVGYFNLSIEPCPL